MNKDIYEGLNITVTFESYSRKN